MKNRLYLNHKPKYNVPVLIVIAGVLALVGIYLVFRSHAATNNADFNSDNVVNITDLSVLASHYNTTGQSHTTGDANGDGTVNITDLSVLATQWGTNPGGGAAADCSTYTFPGGSQGLSGYPCPANTGVPAGAQLTTYTGTPELTCGTVIDHKIVNSSLDVVGSNGNFAITNNETQARANACVIITNSIIHGVVNTYWTDYNSPGPPNGPLYIADSEITGKPQCQAGGQGSVCDYANLTETNIHAWRVFGHGMRAGVQTDGYSEIHDSYFVADTEVGFNPPQHMDGYITNGAYGRPTLLDHSTWLCAPQYGDMPADCARDFAVYYDNSNDDNTTVTNNFFVGNPAQVSTCASLDNYFHDTVPPDKFPVSSNYIVTGNVFSDNCLSPAQNARFVDGSACVGTSPGDTSTCDGWDAAVALTHNDLWCNNHDVTGDPIKGSNGNVIPNSANCP